MYFFSLAYTFYASSHILFVHYTCIVNDIGRTRNVYFNTHSVYSYTRKRRVAKIACDTSVHLFSHYAQTLNVLSVVPTTVGIAINIAVTAVTRYGRAKRQTQQQLLYSTRLYVSVINVRTVYRANRRISVARPPPLSAK